MASVEGADWTQVPQLLKADGTYFSAAVFVQQFLPPYSHNYVEETVLGDNDVARAVLGDSWSASDGFEVQAWGAGAYVQLSEAATLPATNGILTLRVPDLDAPSGGDLYSVTMTLPPMSKLTTRREGTVQVFTAGVENVRVLGHEAY